MFVKQFISKMIHFLLPLKSEYKRLNFLQFLLTFSFISFQMSQIVFICIYYNKLCKQLFQSFILNDFNSLLHERLFSVKKVFDLVIFICVFNCGLRIFFIGFVFVKWNYFLKCMIRFYFI